MDSAMVCVWLAPPKPHAIMEGLDVRCFVSTLRKITKTGRDNGNSHESLNSRPIEEKGMIIS